MCFSDFATGKLINQGAEKTIEAIRAKNTLNISKPEPLPLQTPYHTKCGLIGIYSSMSYHTRQMPQTCQTIAYIFLPD